MNDRSGRARFIAGAVCPACRAVDRLVVETVDGQARRRCVSCGYADRQDAASGAEPATRLSRRRAAEVTSTVRIVDPRKRSS